MQPWHVQGVRRNRRGSESQVRLVKPVIIWAIILLAIGYMFNLDYASILNGLFHAMQTVHNSRK